MPTDSLACVLLKSAVNFDAPNKANGWVKLKGTKQMAKIWIADDDLFYRKLISEALTKQGHQIWTMHNGLNVMHLLSEDPPDLLILDVFMAPKNGVELLTELNEVFERKGMERIPTIVISGDDSISTELAARKAKANRFLLKPFQKEEIVWAVNDLLELSKKRAKVKN